MENNGKGIFYGVIGVATLIVAIIGATFAFFSASADADDTIEGETMAASTLGLSVTLMEPDANTTKLIPLASSLMGSALSNGCVDSNGDTVCQIYAITVTNNATTGGATVNVGTTLTLTAEGFSNLKWNWLTGTSTANFAIDSSEPAQASHGAAVTVGTDNLAPQASATHYIVIWLEEAGTSNNNEVGLKFTGVVNANAVTEGGGASGITATFTSAQN